MDITDTQAREAVRLAVEEDAQGLPGGVRLRAVKHLREGNQYLIRELLPLVDKAIDQVKAEQPKTILDRQRDAALERMRQQAAEHRTVTEIVLGANPPARRSVGEIVKLGGDYVVEVRDGKQPATWTTVVNGRASMWHFHDQTESVLHLIARRHNDDENSSYHAAFFAGRVLGAGKQQTDEDMANAAKVAEAK